MEALAVIPARGRSERVPRKNLRKVGGKPMIVWTIEAALGAKRVTRTVVSTEDVEIATVARQAGAEVVPQPLESALSGTRSAPVVCSALEYLRETEEYAPERVVLLHPTSPLRRAHHIDEALSLHDQWLGHAVVSFTHDELNGAIYCGYAEDVLKRGHFCRMPIFPYQMDLPAGIDVDTWDDLNEAREAMRGSV